MTTVQVELDDETYRLLEEQARAQGTTVPELLSSIALVQSRGDLSEVRLMARRHLERYAEVFRRLAE